MCFTNTVPRLPLTSSLLEIAISVECLGVVSRDIHMSTSAAWDLNGRVILPISEVAYNNMSLTYFLNTQLYLSLCKMKR